MSADPDRQPSRTAAAIGRELVGLLTRPVPVIATEEGAPMKPWRVGLRSELLALRRPDVGVRAVNRLLAAYTRSASYVIALAGPESQRHGLDGVAVAAVGDAHRAHARQQLAERQARRRERQQQERRREAAARPDGGSSWSPRPAPGPLGIR